MLIPALFVEGQTHEVTQESESPDVGWRQSQANGFL